MDKIIIHDAITGETQILDASPAEQKEIDARRKVADGRIAKELLEATTKAAEKAALLARLGITDDEAKLLLS